MDDRNKWLPTTKGRFTKESAIKHLNFNVHHPGLIQARDAAAQFLEDIYNDRQPYALTIIGETGTGKTHLARAIHEFVVKYIADRASRRDDALCTNPMDRYLCQARFANWGRMMREMINTGDYSREHDFRRFYFYVFDDLLGESSNQRMAEMSSTKLYDALNARHLSRWTVTTANVGLEAIGDRLGSQISSRLKRDNAVVTIPPDVCDYADRPDEPEI